MGNIINLLVLIKIVDNSREVNVMPVNESKKRDNREKLKWYLAGSSASIESIKRRERLVSVNADMAANGKPIAKMSVMFVHYKLGDGKYYIPEGRKAYKSKFFITHSGYLYKVLGIEHRIQPACFKFELVKKYNPTEIGHVILETGAVLALKV
jgi:hypothetical protein